MWTPLRYEPTYQDKNQNLIQTLIKEKNGDGKINNLNSLQNNHVRAKSCKFEHTQNLPLRTVSDLGQDWSSLLSFVLPDTLFFEVIPSLDLSVRIP